jgi:Tfp pilus assembly protein PilF
VESPPRETETASRRAGPYELLEELGEGPHGTTWKARHATTGALFSVKLLQPEPLDAARRARLRREVRVQSALDHPSLAKLVDAGEEGASTYVASALLAGSPLRRRLASGPLPAAGVLELGAKLASIVAHAHESGLVHGGLKPENVLLDEQGEPRVTDFGLTRALGLESPEPETVAYLAPEQATAADAVVDPRADVWSIGAILSEALAGRPAFEGALVSEVLAAIRDRDPRELAVREPLDHDAAAIVLRCLEKDRAHRYADAAELAQDCRRALRGEPLIAPRPSALVRRWRRLARRPALLAGAAFGFACLALALFFACVLASWDRWSAETELANLKAAVENAATARAARDTAVERAHRELEIRALRSELEEAAVAGTPPAEIRAKAQTLAALDPSRLVAVAYLLLAADLPEDAAPLLERASRTESSATAALLALADLDEAQGKDASATYKKLVERPGVPEDEHVLAARAALDSDPKSAVELLTRALERDRRSARLHVRRARARARLGELDAALADLEAATSLDPRLARAFLDRAHLHALKGEPALALGDAERALALAPRSAFAYVERARVRRALHLAREARADLDRALGLRPDFASAFVLRGELANDSGDGPAAVADFDRAVELAPRSGEAHVARSTYRFAHDDPAGALADAESAVAAAPDLAEGWASRSAVRARRGDRAAAAADLRKAIALWGARAPDEARAELTRLEKH